MTKTSEQYDTHVSLCRDVFAKKTKDYGTSWRILRPKSLTDQLFIKAQRIKTLEETDVRKVDEGIENEFIGLVNYAVMGLIQMKLPTDTGLELTETEALAHYDKEVSEIKALMMA